MEANIANNLEGMLAAAASSGEASRNKRQKRKKKLRALAGSDTEYAPRGFILDAIADTDNGDSRPGSAADANVLPMNRSGHHSAAKGLDGMSSRDIFHSDHHQDGGGLSASDDADGGYGDDEGEVREVRTGAQRRRDRWEAKLKAEENKFDDEHLHMQNSRKRSTLQPGSPSWHHDNEY